MRPRDPDDVVPGWLYEILRDWEQNATFVRDYGHGGAPLQELGNHVQFEYTLADARDSLASLARSERRVELRASSANRYYGSDGEQQITLRIRAVEDEQERWAS